jgi:predicted alpha/beta-fold hydrolase
MNVPLRYKLPCDSFADLDFRPLPMLGNPHVQSVLGALPRHVFVEARRRHVVWLPDGDGLLVHDNPSRRWRPGQPMALIIHGLSGNATQPHVQRLATMLMQRGVRAFRLDLRGTGDGLPLARNVYHGARSDDIRAALAYMHKVSPASPLLLLGMSLGGSLALRVAGEMPVHPVPGLARVAALSPPIDLARCASMLARPANRIYEEIFVRCVLDEARRRQRYFPDLPPLRFPRGRLTFRLFDDHYTAPRCGYSCALEYYHHASVTSLLAHIHVPTLILSARDDPFIAIEPFEATPMSSHVVVRIVSQGGHIGFVGPDGAGGIRWGERRMVEWVLAGINK